MSIYKQLININIDAPAHKHIHTDSPAEAVALQCTSVQSLSRV